MLRSRALLFANTTEQHRYTVVAAPHLVPREVLPHELTVEVLPHELTVTLRRA